MTQGESIQHYFTPADLNGRTEIVKQFLSKTLKEAIRSTTEPKIGLIITHKDHTVFFKHVNGSPLVIPKTIKLYKPEDCNGYIIKGTKIQKKSSSLSLSLIPLTKEDLKKINIQDLENYGVKNLYTLDETVIKVALIKKLAEFA